MIKVRLSSLSFPFDKLIRGQAEKKVLVVLYTLLTFEAIAKMCLMIYLYMIENGESHSIF
jgi:hypothetical protein